MSPSLSEVPSPDPRWRCDQPSSPAPGAASARPLPVTELSRRLDELRKSDDESEARARSAEAAAYEDVSDALGLEVSQGTGAGRVSADILLPFGSGATVTTTVSAISQNRIAFGKFQVTGSVLPAAGQALLDRVFEEPIRLRNIPEGLHLRSVTTTASQRPFLGRVGGLPPRCGRERGSG